MKDVVVLQRLQQVAERLGATATALLPASVIRVDNRLAALCAAPHRCPGYGFAPSCPPHCIGPDCFRQVLAGFTNVLAFKIDAPMDHLRGKGRLALARRVHEIAAGLEQRALTLGVRSALGLAAGSCRELFCPVEENCAVLSLGAVCPHADQARVSLSGLGVDCSALAAAAGWQLEWGGEAEAEETTAGTMGLMLGLVLLA